MCVLAAACEGVRKIPVGRRRGGGDAPWAQSDPGELLASVEDKCCPYGCAGVEGRSHHPSS
jgi:hypothetical protein